MSAIQEVTAAEAQAGLIARELSELILQDQRFRMMMRDIVLHVHLEQQRQREATALQTFFSACKARGITLRLADDDTVKVNDSKLFTTELKAVYMMYRPQIEAALARERDEQRRKKRA